jgi:Zn-dependent alcohol dehydrogenase
MKRIFLIAAGTVTGLGAVLSITPPALSNSVGTVGLGGGVDLGGGAVTPAATQSATASSAATSAPTPTKSSSATAKPTAAATVAPTKPAAPATPAAATGFSGTVNGDSFDARNYGTVSVSATFADGKIASVSASQSPRSWSQQSLTVLLPYVNAGSITVEQVKAHSAASLPCTRSNSCNSQASYTAEAFWASLKTAITKAGL